MTAHHKKLSIFINNFILKDVIDRWLTATMVIIGQHKLLYDQGYIPGDLVDDKTMLSDIAISF